MKTIVTTVIAATVLVSGAALAGEFDLEQACVDYQAENGDTGTDCSCLAEEVGDDADMLTELQGIAEGEIAGEDLSEGTLGALATCTAMPTE